MVDLHCHLLPGLDDGAQNLKNALDLAEKAVAEGITHILCTPHHENGRYVNPKADVVTAVTQLQNELDNRKIPLQIFPGQEIRLFPTLPQQIAENKILFCDLEERYLLIEFPSSEAPSYAIKILGDLVAEGKVPIIVHPERNGTFIKNPNALLDYLDLGCLAQLTAPSLIGKFGRKIQKTAETMVEHGLVQMMASDAHHIQKRTFYLEEAYDFMEEVWGDEKVRAFLQVAKDVLNGDPIGMPEYEEVKKEKRFLIF